VCFPAQGNGRRGVGGAGGGQGSELMQMGGASGSRGSPVKPSVQRSRHYADPPTAGDAAARMERCKGGGMLTIMISDANPGISSTAPSRSETGYYQHSTDSNILPIDSQSERGSGSLPEGLNGPRITRSKMGEGRWRLHTVKRTCLSETGFMCSVWSVIKGDNVQGFTFVKQGRARVSWDVIAPRGRSRTRR